VLLLDQQVKQNPRLRPRKGYQTTNSIFIFQIPPIIYKFQDLSYHISEDGVTQNHVRWNHYFLKIELRKILKIFGLRSNVGGYLNH